MGRRGSNGRGREEPLSLALARATNDVAQERIAERKHVRGLLEIAGAVAAPRRLVEEHAVALRLQARGHLAGVAWMHAIVSRRGPEEYRRIIASGLREVIRRYVFQERPILRHVRIAVF